MSYLKQPNYWEQSNWWQQPSQPAQFNTGAIGDYNKSILAPAVAPFNFTQPGANLAGVPSFPELAPTRTYAFDGNFAGMGDWGKSMAATAASTPGFSQEPGFFQKFFGSTYDDKTGVKTVGPGVGLLSAAQGIGNLFLGMKSYGLAKKQLKESTRRYNLEHENQRTLTNERLESRQKARVASNSSAYESVGSYMDRNKVK